MNIYSKNLNNILSNRNEYYIKGFLKATYPKIKGYLKFWKIDTFIALII